MSFCTFFDIHWLRNEPIHLSFTREWVWFLYTKANTQVISLLEETCSWNKWQSFKIPCSHVLVVCNYMHFTYISCIDECYLLSNFKNCYDNQFYPIQYPNYWSELLIFAEVRPNANLLGEPGRPSNPADIFFWISNPTEPL